MRKPNREIKQSQQGYRAYQNRPVKTPADEALDTELNQRFQAYITGMQPMLKYAKNGMFEAIINHESEQIRPLDNAYTDILNKAVKIRSTRANQLAELAHQRTRLGGMFMIGAFVLALVMTLITFMVLRRIVIRPLQHAAQRIEKIASGDLTMKDEPAGRNEIGRLMPFTANAAFTGDDSRDCSTGCGRVSIAAPAKFQLAMRTCHLAPKNKRRQSNKLPPAWSNSLRR